MWLVFALLSALFGGVTAILAKVGVKNMDSYLATAIRTVVVLIFSWLMVFITQSTCPPASLSVHTYIFLILSGAATGASWLCYFKALQLGNVTKVTPVDKCSTVLTIILACLFLNEPFTLFKLLAILCITIGTYAMIIPPKTVPVKAANCKWFFYAVGSAFFASLTAILGKIGIQQVNSTLGTAIRTIVVVIMAWGIVFLTKKQGLITKTDPKSWVFLLFSGITTGLSWLCYYRALQQGQASVVVPIDKLSIVITVAFSYFVLKEKLTQKAFLGLVFIIVGTLLLLV
ncbi:MAG: EamA family transporter [Oscillospiraceae bacterium]|nr:EamA family transporter [Oscillospiraceae bacterium]